MARRCLFSVRTRPLFRTRRQVLLAAFAAVVLISAVAYAGVLASNAQAQGSWRFWVQAEDADPVQPDEWSNDPSFVPPLPPGAPEGPDAPNETSTDTPEEPAAPAPTPSSPAQPEPSQEAPAPEDTPAPPAPVTGLALHVSPAGSDSGSGAAGQPMKTIQAALEKAQPGTTIVLAPGVYRGKVTTVRSGTAGSPIRIVGPEQGKNAADRRKAILYGTSRIFNIDHSYIHLSGFTIDGQEKLAGRTFPTSISSINSFKDSVQSEVSDGRLVYIGSADDSQDLTGISIDNMFLTGAGGECVRMRNNAHHNSVTNSLIQYCGMFSKGDGEERAAYHNGEGVYIGTSPKSSSQPMYENDPSAFNVVRGNTIRTFGSECFNVKENAHDNTFESNVCSGNTESGEFNGSTIELRGYNNTIRNNVISDSANWLIKIQSDSSEYDKGGNKVMSNTFSNAAGEAIHIKSKAQQGTICGNTIKGSVAATPPAFFASCS